MSLPFKMTPFETEHLPKAVLGILERHQGRNRAITGRDIASTLGHGDDRKIRLAIRELIRQGYPVASSVSEPMGFYLCQSGHEAQAYIGTLRQRAQEDLLRLQDFERAAACQFDIPQQAALPLGGG